MMETINALAAIEKITGGNKAETKKLIEIFIRQTSLKLTLIDSCLQNRDWNELKNIAHFFKSNFLILNLQKPATLAETIRTSAGIDEKTTIQQARELVIICQQIITELEGKSKI